MAKTPKYPNPKFFKAKDNIDWKKQWENLKAVSYTHLTLPTILRV